MTAANRGTMRPNGRSPPFLIIGLVVALVILAFNYWNLSIKNGEQSNEISMLQSEMRLVSAKKVSAEKRNEAISDKVKDLESEINMQKGIVAEKMALVSTLEQEKQDNQQLRTDLEYELNTYKNEKLPQCESDKATLTTQMQEIQGNLDKLKETPQQASSCDQSSCQVFISKSRDETLEDIRKVAGVGPLLNLYRAGGNVGGLVQEMSQLHNQGAQMPGPQDFNAGQINQPQQQVGFQPQAPAAGDQQLAGNQVQYQQQLPEVQQSAGDQQQVGGQQPVGDQLPAGDAGQPSDVENQQVAQVPSDNGRASPQQENSKANLGVGDVPSGVNVVQPNIDQAGDGNIERKEEDAPGSPNEDNAAVPPMGDEGREEDKNAVDGDEFDQDDDDEVGDGPIDDLKMNDEDKDEEDYDYDDEQEGNQADEYEEDNKNNELQNEDKGIDEMQQHMEQDNLQG